MDPQPLNHYEWHLYEYEINKCDACALYRLELKLVDGKKSSKGKVMNESVADLQKQMVRLSAEFPSDNKRSVKGRSKVSTKVATGAGPETDALEYGIPAPTDYLVENISEYYLK